MCYWFSSLPEAAHFVAVIFNYQFCQLSSVILTWLHSDYVECYNITKIVDYSALISQYDAALYRVS